MWPRSFQGSLGCGDGTLPLLCWSHVKGPSQSAKVARIPSQSPKILERSLATRQIFRSLGFFLGIFDVCPRIFQGSLGCGDGSLPLLCWSHVKGSSQNAKVAKIPSQSPKIPERSLATRQIFPSLGFFEGSLTCGQGSFKDPWGVATDLCHFCVGHVSRVPHRAQKWQRSQASPQRSLKDPWPHVKYSGRLASLRDL